MRDFVTFVVIPIIAFVVICLITLFVGCSAESYQCSKYKEATGKETKYQGGMCFVKENGTFMEWNEYKLRFATKGE